MNWRGYIWIDKRWLYLATVMDLYSRRFVGWTLGEDMTESLITEVMRMALNNREVSSGLIVLFDRGTQYAERLLWGRHCSNKGFNERK